MSKIKQGLLLLGLSGFFLGFARLSFALPVGYSVRGDVDDKLYKINFATGSKVEIGPVHSPDVEGLAFDPLSGLLYGIDDKDNTLITIDIGTGAGSLVAPLERADGSSVEPFPVQNPGFAISPSGLGFISHDPSSVDSIYTVDLSSGFSVKLGNTGVNGIDGLAFLGNTLYGTSDRTRALYTINTTSGHADLVFSLGTSFKGETGLAYDGEHLWAISDKSKLYEIDLDTQTSTVTHLFAGSGFEGLAIQPSLAPVPEPTSLLLLLSGILGLAGWQKRRSARG